jgi:hypothetical protein
MRPVKNNQSIRKVFQANHGSLKYSDGSIMSLLDILPDRY